MPQLTYVEDEQDIMDGRHIVELKFLASNCGAFLAKKHYRSNFLLHCNPLDNNSESSTALKNAAV
jgi:hypothetical protein